MRTFPMIAAGVLAMQGCADNPDELEERPSRVSGFFLARRADAPCAGSPNTMCNGFALSALNAASTRCADGSYAPACAVSSIDTSALALPTEQAGSLIADASPSLSSPTLVLRGAIAVRGGRVVFVASEAWRAPVAAAVRGSFHLVSARSPDADTLRDERVNALLEPEFVARVELANLRNMLPFMLDLAERDAASETGLLVAGTRSEVSGRAVLRAEQVFLRVRALDPASPK